MRSNKPLFGAFLSWMIALFFVANISFSATPGSPQAPAPRSDQPEMQADVIRERTIAKLNGMAYISEGSALPSDFAKIQASDKSVVDPTSKRESPAPLKFAFPTTVFQPVSAWRPPLYPVPWALTPYDHFYFLRPILADEINWPNADYRYGGVFFEGIVHTGVDIPAPIGTPVLAAGSGRITWAGYGLFSGKYDEQDPYGLAVQIRHDFGFNGIPLYTVYAHLSQVNVTPGQGVQAGDVIGLSGDTGKVTGPHLHFEVRLKEGDYFSTRNPELWMVPPQGWGVLAGRVMNTGGRKLHGQLVTVRALSDINCPTCLSWKAYTYGGGYTYPDPFYQENVVISDLPAGRYEIQINYLGKAYSLETDIRPGLITYFTFRGRSGFTNEPLKLPGADFSP